MPAPNTDGTPSIATPIHDTRRTQPTPTNTMNHEVHSHPSGQGAAANTGRAPATTTPLGDPDARRSQDSSTTMTPMNRDHPAHRSEAVHPEGPSMAMAHPDTGASLRRSNTTGTTLRATQAQRSAQDSHYGTSEDHDSRAASRQSLRYPDNRDHRSTQGRERERKSNVLTKPAPSSKEAAAARNRSTRERTVSQSASSNDSVEFTMGPRGGHSNSLADKERRSNTTTTASAQAQAHVQSQLKHGSQHTSYSRAHLKEEPQHANHPETRSKAPDTRASDSINSRPSQVTSGPKAAQLPAGAAVAQPPTANGHRESQPGEEELQADEQPQGVAGDDSADDLFQVDDVGPDSSHSQLPLGLSPEEGQRVQGEVGEGHIAQPSGYLAGFRNIAGAILGPGTGPGQPPRDKTKEELQRTRAKFQQLDYEFRRMKTDNANMHRTCLELDSENRRHKETIRSLHHELTNTQRELQEYKHLSDIRGKELIGAQVFLTKADLLSISDVKEKVNALNDENFQASATLGDSLVHCKYELTKEEKEAAFAAASRTISEPLARALMKEAQKPELEINPLVVQVVLEMYLVHFCSSLIESWFPGNRETSDFLTSVYTEIRRTEEQAVSGRWRALTRAKIRPTSASWRDEFMKGLGNIFTIAEWRIGSQENLIAFEQKLPAIFKAVEDLRLALGEKVTSIDLEISAASPGFPFDHWWMEDGYADGRKGNTKKSGESVVGTTGIGLKQFIRSPSGEERFDNVLSPKVVLVSTLQEALCPPSPAPVRSSKKARTRAEGEPEGKGRSSPPNDSMETS